MKGGGGGGGRRGDKPLRSASYKSRHWMQVIRQFHVAVFSVIPTEKRRR